MLLLGASSRSQKGGQAASESDGNDTVQQRTKDQNSHKLCFPFPFISPAVSLMVFTRDERNNQCFQFSTDFSPRSHFSENYLLLFLRVFLFCSIAQHPGRAASNQAWICLWTISSRRGARGSRKNHIRSFSRSSFLRYKNEQNKKKGEENNRNSGLRLKSQNTGLQGPVQIFAHSVSLGFCCRGFFLFRTVY